MQNLALLLAVAIPATLLIILRTNAAIAFLSLCAGSVLVTYVGNEVGTVGAMINSNSNLVSEYLIIALFIVPVVLSAVLLGKSVYGPKNLLNVLPAIGVGLVGTLMIVPFLPMGLNDSIMKTDGWSVLHNNQSVIVLISVVISLVSLWMSRPKTGNGKKKHH